MLLQMEQNLKLYINSIKENKRMKKKLHVTWLTVATEKKIYLCIYSYL